MHHNRGPSKVVHASHLIVSDDHRHIIFFEEPYMAVIDAMDGHKRSERDDVYSIHSIADSRILIDLQGNKVIWSLGNLESQQIAVRANGRVSAVEVMPDHRLAAIKLNTYDDDLGPEPDLGKIAVVDLQTQQVMSEFSVPKGSISFSKNGERLLVGGELFDTRSGVRLFNLNRRGTLSQFSPNQQLIITQDSLGFRNDSVTNVFLAESGAFLFAIMSEAGIKFSSDSSTFAVLDSYSRNSDFPRVPDQRVAVYRAPSSRAISEKVQKLLAPLRRGGDPCCMGGK
jgi:hypothetical protein